MTAFAVADGRVTVVYLHGFRSSPASAKANELAAAVAALPEAVRPALWIPDLDDHPHRAIAKVHAWIGDARCDPARLTFVGSSLGGYYATHLADRYGARAALVNPAVRPYDDLRPYLGPQTNLYTGRVFEVTEAHFDELVALRVPRIARPERHFLLVQTGDEVLDWHESVAFYGGAWQYVEGGGDHGFQRFAEQIPAILRFAGVDLPAGFGR